MKLSQACELKQQPKAENKVRAVCDTLLVPVSVSVFIGVT